MGLLNSPRTKKIIKITELSKICNNTKTNKVFESLLENKRFKVVRLKGYPIVRMLKVNQDKLQQFINKNSTNKFI